MWRGREKEASRYLPHHFLLWPRFSYSCSCIFFTKYDPPKETNKQTNKVLQATSHVCRLRSGCEPTFFWPTTVTAKPKTSRQKQKHHGETKNLTAKTKYVTAKPKTSRQNQILHSKNKIALVLPWVFAFAVRYLVFAVKYLFLPWGLWFCREGFGFVVRYFVFSVRFLVLPWGFRFCGEVFCFCRDSCVGHRSERLDYHFDLRARRQLSHLSLFGWWLQ